MVQAIGSFGNWPAADSGIGLAVMAGQGDESIRRLYDGHDLAGYEQGIEGLLERLGEIRHFGYAVAGPDDGLRGTMLAVSLASNPIIGVGITGRFREGELRDLLGLLKAAVSKIDASAENFRAGPAGNLVMPAV